MKCPGTAEVQERECRAHSLTEKGPVEARVSAVKQLRDGLAMAGLAKMSMGLWTLRVALTRPGPHTTRHETIACFGPKLETAALLKGKR